MDYGQVREELGKAIGKGRPEWISDGMMGGLLTLNRSGPEYEKACLAYNKVRSIIGE